MWRASRSQPISSFQNSLKQIENPTNLFLAAASFWLVGTLCFILALSSHYWVRHQLVHGVIGDYHGLLQSCAGREISKKIDGCSLTEWSLEKVPVYILVSRWVMIVAGIFLLIATLSSIGLRSAFSSPPYPNQRFFTRYAGLIFIVGSLFIFISCTIFMQQANSTRDGIFIHGPDEFFSDALAISSSDTEYFQIYNFFEKESGEKMKPLFSLNFEGETKPPAISQTFSVSFFFAWFAGAFFIASGILAFILSRRLELESRQATIYTALTFGLFFDPRAKKEALYRSSQASSKV